MLLATFLLHARRPTPPPDRTAHERGASALEYCVVAAAILVVVVTLVVVFSIRADAATLSTVALTPAGPVPTAG